MEGCDDKLLVQTASLLRSSVDRLFGSGFVPAYPSGPAGSAARL